MPGHYALLLGQDDSVGNVDWQPAPECLPRQLNPSPLHLDLSSVEVGSCHPHVHLLVPVERRLAKFQPATTLQSQCANAVPQQRDVTMLQIVVDRGVTFLRCIRLHWCQVRTTKPLAPKSSDLQSGTMARTSH
jgi:hypothetical protein